MDSSESFWLIFFFFINLHYHEKKILRINCENAGTCHVINLILFFSVVQKIKLGVIICLTRWKHFSTSSLPLNPESFFTSFLKYFIHKVITLLMMMTMMITMWIAGKADHLLLQLCAVKKMMMVMACPAASTRRLLCVHPFVHSLEEYVM